MPQVGRTATLQAEGLERNAGLFSDLERWQSKIDIEWKTLSPHLIEHRPAAFAIRQIAKAPRQLFVFSLLSHGIAKRHPAAACHLVHDERVSGAAEEELLVVSQRDL